VTSADDVRLRAAVPADEQTARECVVAAYSKYVRLMGKEPAPMLCDYAQLIEDGLVTVAEDDNGLVGVIVGWAEADHYYVDNIAVLPGTQGRGIGSVLLHAAEDAARRDGFDEVRLYTNEAMVDNLEYYPRRGYEETSRSDESGYKRVYYVKRLR
jgi:ribosomal protein S18 acetylase RimI-like enzyme